MKPFRIRISAMFVIRKEASKKSGGSVEKTQWLGSSQRAGSQHIISLSLNYLRVIYSRSEAEEKIITTSECCCFNRLVSQPDTHRPSKRLLVRTKESPQSLSFFLSLSLFLLFIFIPCLLLPFLPIL
ncbi:hypothetical protein AWENTII_001788 [Aspergillus wentii]